MSHEDKNVTNITQNDLDFIKNLESKRSSIDSFIKEIDYVKRDWTNCDKFDHYSKDLVLSTTDWDDDAIINAGDNEYSIVKPINELLLNNPLDNSKQNRQKSRMTILPTTITKTIVMSKMRRRMMISSMDK